MATLSVALTSSRNRKYDYSGTVQKSSIWRAFFCYRTSELDIQYTDMLDGRAAYFFIRFCYAGNDRSHLVNKLKVLI